MKRNARVGLPTYTYHQPNKEEKLIYRRMLIIGGLTIVLVLIIWFWGITFIRIIGALGIKDNQTTTENSTNLPLQKPTINDLPDYTNQDKITVSGSTTANVSVVLSVNGTQFGKTTADTDGGFSFTNISLEDGINLIKVTATNSSKDSEETKAIINLDKTAPSLQISQPTDGQTLPAGTQNVTIKGVTEPDATVLVNSIQSLLDPQGNFSYVFSLNPGENKIEVKSTDKAGNETVINLSVTVQQ